VLFRSPETKDLIGHRRCDPPTCHPASRCAKGAPANSVIRMI